MGERAAIRKRGKGATVRRLDLVAFLLCLTLSWVFWNANPYAWGRAATWLEPGDRSALQQYLMVLLPALGVAVWAAFLGVCCYGRFGLPSLGTVLSGSLALPLLLPPMVHFVGVGKSYGLAVQMGQALFYTGLCLALLFPILLARDLARARQGLAKPVSWWR